MSEPVSSSPRRERWPLFGVAAGITGALATVGFDTHAGGGLTGDATSMAIIDQVNQRNAHLGIIFGFTTVALLLILAACWRTIVEPRLPESIAARVVSGGITAAAGALSLGYGWKGALGLYHPDGAEANAYDQMGLYVYYILNDFGAWIGWLGVNVAAGAFVWMGLKERSIPLWLGFFSVVPIIPAWGMMIATGLPGLSVVSTIWMVIAFAGLALHKGAIRVPAQSGAAIDRAGTEAATGREGFAQA